MDWHLYLIIGLVIIIIISFLYYFKNHKSEGFFSYFTDRSIDQLTFREITDQDEALNILTSDLYVSSFSQADYYARDIIPAKPDVYRQIVKHKIKTLDDTDRNAFQWMIHSFKELYPALVKSSKSKIWNYYLFEFDLIKGEEIDGRMPHTHEHSIIFDQNYFDNLVEKHKKNELMDMLEEEAETFIHEMTHLLERNNTQIKELFSQCYQELGFSVISSIKFQEIIPDKYRFRIRSNPDELPNLEFYFWQDPNQKENKIYQLPLIVYNSDKPQNLSDTSAILLSFKLEDDSKFVFVKKENIAESKYHKFIGINNNNYHPKEIMAEYMAQWFLLIVGEFGGNIDQETEGFKLFQSLVLKNKL